MDEVEEIEGDGTDVETRTLVVHAFLNVAESKIKAYILMLCLDIVPWPLIKSNCVVRLSITVFFWVSLT